jgi:hypothetical protein
VPHPVGIFTETMKHPADLAGERPELRERVVKGVALMDDTVQSGFDGNFELLPEYFRLLLFVTRVVSGVAGFFAGQMVVIQAGFTDGHDFGMFYQFTQGGADVVRRLVGVGRVPANGGEDARETVRF